MDAHQFLLGLLRCAVDMAGVAIVLILLVSFATVVIGMVYGAMIFAGSHLSKAIG